MDLKNKKVLLIGGAGFIGHNLALRLKMAGADVAILDSLGVNNFLSFQQTSDEVLNRNLYLKIIRERLDLLYDNEIPLFTQDARDYHAVSRVVEEVKPTSVVHLAAVAHANRSNKNPFNTFDHSLRTLENALDACKGRVDQFVYFSSSMVYGNFEKDYVDEETPCDPLGIYAALKFSGEKIVTAYNQVFDLPYTIIRPSALYGERCVSRRVGQAFIENALQGINLSVNGDGSDSLDFTYIEDLCQGIMRVLSHEKAKNETFNLTYGMGHTINQMIEIVKQEFPDVTVNFQKRDVLMPIRGTLMVDKARDLIGYDPQWPLAKGFVKYIEWYKKLYSEI